MKTSTLLLGLFLCVVFTTGAQKIKTKDIKRELEQGKVADAVLLIEDRFTPGSNLEFDLKVTLENGLALLASEQHIIWDYATVTVDNAPYKIRGEFLANGKGVIKPRDPAAYYPNVQAKVTIEIASKKLEKTLTPLHCYSNLLIDRSGDKGSSGGSGSNGYSGSNGRGGGDGENGTSGPDISVQITEEVIDGKPHMVATIDERHYPLDPSCSKITIVSKAGAGGKGGDGGDGGESNKDTSGKYQRAGGNGGNGGNGGQGGNGGTITISGEAYTKYKDIINIISQGGNGGSAGSGGSSGKGSSYGSRGISGTNGRDGSSGRVVVKNQ